VLPLLRAPASKAPHRFRTSFSMEIPRRFHADSTAETPVLPAILPEYRPRQPGLLRKFFQRRSPAFQALCAERSASRSSRTLPLPSASAVKGGSEEVISRASSPPRAGASRDPGDPRHPRREAPGCCAPYRSGAGPCARCTLRLREIGEVRQLDHQIWFKDWQAGP